MRKKEGRGHDVMVCFECDRLLAECGRLKRTYTTAVQARIACMATTPATEYRKLQIAAEEAWIDSECDILEFSQHKRSHAKAN